MSRPLVEILYFEGCPNHEQTRELVAEVAGQLGLQPEIALVEVSDGQAAERWRFLGSPTVRVEGRDVEPGAEERHEFVLSCRIYRSKNGISGRPDADWIRTALTEAAR
jgi:hypothetical protein